MSKNKKHKKTNWEKTDTIEIYPALSGKGFIVIVTEDKCKTVYELDKRQMELFSEGMTSIMLQG